MNRITLIAVGLTLMFAQTTHAQKNKGGLAINAGAGFSMFGILGSLNFSIKDDFTVESKATPALVGSFDYAFENNISLGLGGGYQEVSQKFTDYMFMDENGIEQAGSFSYELTRINVGARLLFHFGNGRMDAYAGIKPGVNIYNLKLDMTSDIPEPSWLRTGGSTFALQVIPIGFRGYFTDNIGFFMETGIGAPSFISAGLCIGVQMPTEPIQPTN